MSEALAARGSTRKFKWKDSLYQIQIFLFRRFFIVQLTTVSTQPLVTIGEFNRCRSIRKADEMSWSQLTSVQKAQYLECDPHKNANSATDVVLQIIHKNF
jgi:hypothetical protein